MNKTFSISFRITEEEWERTAELREAPDSEPIFDCFTGDVVVSFGKDNLFERGSYHMSVADLACGLAAVLEEGFPDVTRTAVFRQSDDSLEITLDVHNGQIRLTSNWPPGSLIVEKDAFVSGTQDFIKHFTRQAVDYVPGALTWKDLKALSPFWENTGNASPVSRR